MVFACFSPKSVALKGESCSQSTGSAMKTKAAAKVIHFNVDASGGSEGPLTKGLPSVTAPEPSTPKPPPEDPLFKNTEYAALCRRLVATCDALRAGGAGGLLEVPRIVVAGNQSAGKSSLLEALAGVPLPRSDGTCTRCPTEVRMSDAPPPWAGAGPWGASVHVRREWDDARGARLPQPQEVLIQDCINSPCDLDPALRAAQDAALVSPPATGAAEVAGGAAAVGNGRALFSRNVVVLQVWGAPVSLSLVDLPGIIHAVDHGPSPAPAPTTMMTNQADMSTAGGMSRPHLLGGAHHAPHPSQPPSSSFASATSLAPSLTSFTTAPAPGAGAGPTAAGNPSPLGRASNGVGRASLGPAADGAAGLQPHQTSVAGTNNVGASPSFPELVRGLVREHAGRPGAILVAVVTCKEDADTQGILALARELDPSGVRTLGVLTKPDAVEEGCHAPWVDMLCGKRWPLRLGYYVVRNPGQAALAAGSLSHDAARAAEALFFSNTEPWAGLSQGPLGVRMGCARLRTALARLLAEAAARELPRLQAEARAQLKEVEGALSRLPPSPLAALAGGLGSHRPGGAARMRDDPAAGLSGRRANIGGAHQGGLVPDGVAHRAMAALLDDVCAAVGAQLAPHGGGSASALGAGPSYLTPVAGSGSAHAGLHGGGDLGSGGIVPDRALWGSLMGLFRKFKAGVNAGRPVYEVGGCVFSATTDDDDDDCNVDGEGGAYQYGSGGGVTVRAAQLPAGATNTAAVGGPQTGVIPNSGRAGAIASEGGAWRGDGLMVMAGCGADGVSCVVYEPPVPLPPLSLAQVRALVEAHRGLELPGFSPYSALTALVARSSAGWGRAAEALLLGAESALRAAVLGVLAAHMGRFPAAHRAAQAAVQALLSDLAEATGEQLGALVAQEASGAFTMNICGFERASSAALARLRSAAAGMVTGSIPAAGVGFPRAGQQGAASVMGDGGSCCSGGVSQACSCCPSPPPSRVVSHGNDSGSAAAALGARAAAAHDAGLLYALPQQLGGQMLGPMTLPDWASSATAGHACPDPNPTSHAAAALTHSPAVSTSGHMLAGMCSHQQAAVMKRDVGHPLMRGVGHGLSSLTCDQVLTMMAVSLAYFGVSSRRMADAGPLALMHHLVAALRAQLKGTLTAELLAGRDGAAVAGLLEEDEYVARTRAGLAAQRVALEGALAALRAAAPAAGTAEH